MSDRANTTIEHRRDQVVCAYVATSYVLERRHVASVRTLAKAGPQTSSVIEGLNHPERAKRAHALALALEPILKQLDSRRVL